MVTCGFTIQIKQNNASEGHMDTAYLRGIVKHYAVIHKTELSIKKLFIFIANTNSFILLI